MQPTQAKPDGCRKAGVFATREACLKHVSRWINSTVDLGKLVLILTRFGDGNWNAVLMLRDACLRFPDLPGDAAWMLAHASKRKENLLLFVNDGARGTRRCGTTRATLARDLECETEARS